MPEMKKGRKGERDVFPEYDKNKTCPHACYNASLLTRRDQEITDFGFYVYPRAFDVSSSWIACVGQFSVAQKCVVRFTGRKAKPFGKPRTVRYDCPYSGGGAGGTMELCVTASLTRLTGLRVEVIGFAPEAVFNVLQVDDVTGTVYR